LEYPQHNDAIGTPQNTSVITKRGTPHNWSILNMTMQLAHHTKPTTASKNEVFASSTALQRSIRKKKNLFDFVPYSRKHNSCELYGSQKERSLCLIQEKVQSCARLYGDKDSD